MRVIIEANATDASNVAAEIIRSTIARKPNAVLGLATGGTPVTCYQRLIEYYQRGELDFSSVRTFNLDEYVGLPLTHPECYHQFMQRHLFSHVNLVPENCRIPNPTGDMNTVCREYEEAIREAGGIDLQLLGIGRDGHIGFNEPGSSLAGRTRVKHLSEETIQDNARFFAGPQDVPRLAITMGVGTILEAARCLLLATGESKAVAVRDMAEGPITAMNPASALQWHQSVVLVLDESAAHLLRRREYYLKAERAQRELVGGLE